MEIAFFLRQAWCITASFEIRSAYPISTSRNLMRQNPVPAMACCRSAWGRARNPAAIAELPALAGVRHVFVKAAARVNNRAENSHQPIRERERRMKGFRSPRRTQRFLSSFGAIRQYFAIKREQLGAVRHRSELTRRFVAWHHITGVIQNPSTAG